MGKTEENGARSTSLRFTENETKISYLIKDIEDLSDMITKQGRVLDKLSKQVDFLMQKETERNDLNGIILGDKPPHW